MSKKVTKPNQNMQVWIDAGKRHRLSDAQIQMARELGMNPKKFGGMDNHRQQPWKLPLPEFIEELYFERFGKGRPEVFLSVEDQILLGEKKKARQSEEKRLRREAQAAGQAKPATGST
jgi:hypothetical protein